MSEPRKFDEQTHWDEDPGGVRAGGAGWAPPGADFFIDRADPYWGRVLDKARHAYGDPNMSFDTDNVSDERHLVFGDGTRVPTDGSLAYRDAANNKTYLLNRDGTVSALGPNGQAGQPVSPAYRTTGDGAYMPIDASGHQVAPLTSGVPPAPNGYHDEHGVLTPKNARGDYYVDDPATGARRYFDASGRPITEEQFGDTAPSAPSVALPTDEQQSGRAADAVKKMHDELQGRYSKLSDAETKLSEVLLGAHATTADGQQKLQQIQHTIVEAVNNPALALDTPAGEQAFLKLLRGQVAAIGDVVKSGTLSAEDQSKAIEALTNLYAADPGSAPANPTTPDTSAPTPAPVPAAAEPAPVDADLGSEEPMPDPTLADLGLGGAPGTDPLASLASALPAALGTVGPGGLGGGWGGDPLSSLGGLTGAIPQLAGLAAQQDEQPRRDDTEGSNGDEQPADKDIGEAKPAAPQADSPAASPPQPEHAGAPAEGAPPAADNPAPPPVTTVSLPDGSTATAKTAALAAAVKSYLSGTPVDAAYRAAGIDLPPPGTPVTTPIDPSSLSCGAIGMFKDHYVVALSSAKALADGQVVPLSSAASGPDFLGWMDPSAAPAPPVAAVPPT